MTETALAQTVVAPAGLDISDTLLTQGLTGGHKFLNNGKQMLIVQNGDVASTIATIVTQAVSDGDLAIGDRAVTVAASKRKLIGPFKPSLYNDSDGYVHFTLSNFTTGVLVGLVQFVPDAG